MFLKKSRVAFTFGWAVVAVSMFFNLEYPIFLYGFLP